ncbi:hypothetical protein HPB47_026909 [Ixodes persulcatus]|uniref:Uncharacterized protein n=1 Tax=Ixodes persulcatus TaxID=34615 RepID=A0AC60PXP1_IXOPE|nr:hypothetical protein HPB47_026909 [Ixodes persulcatus]
MAEAEARPAEPAGWAKALMSVCSLMFGVSAWVSINGLWVQMPLLVPRLPEGWNLGSILVIVIQVANLGPLAYTLARKRVQVKAAVHATLFVGLTAGVLLVFLWQETVGGHSVAFIALAFFLSMVDCTSSVLYMPFMARYPQQFLFWYMVGEGLSGLVPAGLALAQGVDNKADNETTSNATYGNATHAGGNVGPRFSIEVFLSLLCVIVAISWAAFSVLAHLPVLVDYQIPGQTLKKKKEPSLKYGSNDNRGYVPEDGTDHAVPQVPEQPSGLERAGPSDGPGKGDDLMKRWQWNLALAMQSTIAALSNGVLLAVQTYSSLPYGQLPYHLATNLATIANPLSCAMAGLLPVRSLWALVLFTLGGLVSAGYILFLAVESPEPILVGTVTGAALMVFAWVAFVSLMTFVKSRLAAGMMSHGGARSLLWYGVATQGGSFVGALTMFFVTNYTHVFKSA